MAKKKKFNFTKSRKALPSLEAEDIFQKPRVPITLADYMPKDFEKFLNALACYHVGGDNEIEVQENETCPHYDAYSVCEKEIIFIRMIL